MKLRKKFNFDTDEESCFEGDIQARMMGGSGVDIMLSPAAKKVIPFDIEAKRQEKLNLWESLKQTEKNTGKDRMSLLVFKRNHTDVYCTLKFDDLLALLG